MFTKQFTDIDKADIEDLFLQRAMPESHNLDYKREIGFDDRSKIELSKDISSFANANGGWLIIGLDEKEKKINGIDPLVGKQKVDEWIANIVISYVEPKPNFLVKTVPLDKEQVSRVIVLIYVFESDKKPHFVNQKNQYYLRNNTVVNAANHYEIRDMFENSRRRTDETESFLAKRNLLDEDDSNFGRNINSKELKSKLTTEFPALEKPIVVFSLIPKFLRDTKFQGTITELKEWMNRYATGYYPLPSYSLFFTNHVDTKIDGLVYKTYETRGYLTTYFEVLNNGYIECGMSDNVAFAYDSNQTRIKGINLTGIVGYQMLLLGFAKKLYEKVGYFDELTIQLSFANVLNFRLFGFHHKYNNLWHYDSSSIQNNQYQRFKLTERIPVTELTDNAIATIGEGLSLKISNAFGLEKDFCFVDKTINLSTLSHLRL